jgi:AcrR family transcriptional regulator
MMQQVDSHRRQEILRAAAGLFRRQGFERTSVRQIAAELGIKSGSLFYHFATKEELLVAVMEEGRSNWRPWCAAI